MSLKYYKTQNLTGVTSSSILYNMLPHELTLFTAAHLVQVERYTVLPEVEEIAHKLRQRLPLATQSLLEFCADAAHHYGKARHAEQHPIPTLYYAQEVLSSIALELQESATELDVDFARAFIADQSQLFALSEGLDPRQSMEDDIADLEAEREMSEGLSSNILY
jgi:hypothetical protein